MRRVAELELELERSRSSEVTTGEVLVLFTVRLHYAPRALTTPPASLDCLHRSGGFRRMQIQFKRGGQGWKEEEDFSAQFFPICFHPDIYKYEEMTWLKRRVLYRIVFSRP